MAERDGDSTYWAGVMRGSPDDRVDADAYEGHLARIRGYVDSWIAGLITVEEKRLAISAENRQFYGPDCPSRLLWRG